MARQLVMIDTESAVVRVRIDRDNAGEVAAARLTMFDAYGSHDVTLTPADVAMLVEALCPPTPPGNA